MKALKLLTNSELIEITHDLARRVSYYNAAEGNWSSEASERGIANAEFNKALDEMQERGLVFENRGYLL